MVKVLFAPESCTALPISVSPIECCCSYISMKVLYIGIAIPIQEGEKHTNIRHICLSVTASAQGMYHYNYSG